MNQQKGFSLMDRSYVSYLFDNTTITLEFPLLS